MNIIIKINNTRFVKGHYNHSAVDKDGNKYIVYNMQNELIKGNYYLLNVDKYTTEVEYAKEKPSVFVKVKEYNSMKALEIVDNKLTLEGNKIKSDTLLISDIDKKLIEKNHKLHELIENTKGAGSAKLLNNLDYDIKVLSKEIKRLENLKSA